MSLTKDVVVHENLQPQARKICIVGAGISGLRAATILATSGFDITILEARNRIGGRIHQTPLFGPLIDLGASWMHGTRGNPLLQLAEEAGSTTVACGAVESICDVDGRWFSREKAKRYYEEVWEILERGMEVSGSRKGVEEEDGKMMDFFRGEVGRRCEQAERPTEYERLMLLIVEMWGAFIGSECEDQSLRNL